MATAATAQLAVTLTDLRRRVADRFGDYDQLVCTGAGTTTTLVDALNVNAGAENFNGRVLLCVTGGSGNPGALARVTTTTDSTSTLTFTPALTTATATGDIFDAFNKRGLGFKPRDYTNAINQAINDAYPLGVIDLQVVMPGTFVATSPEVVVPPKLLDIYDVEWQDTTGDWHRVLKSERSNEYGWRVDQPTGVIRLLGNPAWKATNAVIRLSGYGRQDALVQETDACLLNAEYVVARACYHLAAASLMRDAVYAQMAPMYLQESERLRTRIRTIRRPNTERVRSA